MFQGVGGGVDPIEFIVPDQRFSAVCRFSFRLFSGGIFMTGRSRSYSCCAVILFLVGNFLPGRAGAQAAVPAPAGLQGGVRIERSRQTGLANVVAGENGEAIPLRAAPAAGAPKAIQFLDEYAHLFGVTDRASQLRESRKRVDLLGFTHTSFEQVYEEIPVFGSVIRVHENPDGEVTAANGSFFPIRRPIVTTPSLNEEQAVHQALADIDVADAAATTVRLTIVDPGWYGDPPRGARLAYYIELMGLESMTKRAFFIDAHTGEVLDHWSLIHEARQREIYNGNGGGSLPGTLARAENDPPVASPADVNRAYDFIGDTYDYYDRAFGRDSYDGLGSTILATVNSTAPGCPNAFWNGVRMVYCLGTVTDDIVAHELTHGVTEYTSGLIYQNQPGQLNEAMSDIFGELVDLFNGDAAFVGVVGGPPSWPTHPTGPGTDTPNNPRTVCTDDPPEVFVNSPGDIAGSYRAGTAAFGPALTPTGLTGDLAAVAPSTACNLDLPLNNAQIAGKIALVDRGVCTFVEKVKNVQNVGAVAVIVINNVDGPPFTMGGSDPTITIPSVMLSQADGNLLRNRLSTDPVNATLRNPAPTGEVRWMIGEDATAFGGAIRDMWMPSCKGHPDHANHPFQLCRGQDGGGVHSGSGIANHAFALLTDGGTYNGYTINGIGPIKSGAVWFRAQAFYLTPFSDYAATYAALNLAAADLIGTTPNDPRTGSPSSSEFTAADAAEVDKASLAVEMNTDGLCGHLLDEEPPTRCNGRTIIFQDDFEGMSPGWTVSNVAPTSYDWVLISPLPNDRPGSAWFIEDRNIGNCNTINENGVHYLVSPTIALPSSIYQPKLEFTHYFFTEQGFDGGNVNYRILGSAWQVVPPSAVLYNRYNMTLEGTGAEANPLSGQRAFSGWSGVFGTTQIDLSGLVSGGQMIQIRFVFGKDGCTGFDGWYVDDVVLYTCPNCDVPGVCADNDACTDDECSPILGCVNSATACNDFNDCTTDSCHSIAGCQFTPNNLPCDDGDACTIDTVCSAGTCGGGTALTCNDSNPCTDDSCDSLSGCQFAFNALACDDGNDCTLDDACLEGACTGTQLLDLYGDVAPPGGDGIVEVSDILCLLAGYALPSDCPDGDIFPCPNPDGLIEVGDVLAGLAAYAGNPPCPDPCPP